jgi:hypothetical protein
MIIWGLNYSSPISNFPEGSVPANLTDEVPLPQRTQIQNIAADPTNQWLLNLESHSLASLPPLKIQNLEAKKCPMGGVFELYIIKFEFEIFYVRWYIR